MSERIDVTEIKEKKLSDYSDPEAAGSAYLVGDQPVLQLHKFDDTYTLFWESIPDAPDLNFLMMQLHAEAIQNRYKPPYHSIRIGTLSFTKARRRGKGLVNIEQEYSAISWNPDGFLQKLTKFLDLGSDTSFGWLN